MDGNFDTQSKSQDIALLSEYLTASKASVIVNCKLAGIPILIKGRSGPTGKSTLCKILRKLGYTVAEEWELEGTQCPEILEKFIKGKRDSNTCYVTITLNKMVI